MTPNIDLGPDFVFEGIPPIEDATAAQAVAADPLGPLAPLPGTWSGTGFNAIWRPHNPDSPQDRFLELNLTNETIVFSKIPGQIPNRGLLMPDINMSGIAYLQQISEANNGPALHFEPGIWLNVPPTSNPSEPSTVVRMASIPHGTAILAQGTADLHPGGPPAIPNNNIIPFQVGGPQVNFPELILSTPTQFRHATQGVTQAMVDNPNSILQAAVDGKPMKSRMHIHITTQHTPIPVAGPPTPRSSARHQTRPAETQTQPRSTPPSGSKRCRAVAAAPTSSNCSTPSWSNSTSTASVGRTSPLRRCASNEPTATGSPSQIDRHLAAVKFRAAQPAPGAGPRHSRVMLTPPRDTWCVLRMLPANSDGGCLHAATARGTTPRLRRQRSLNLVNHFVYA